MQTTPPFQFCRSRSSTKSHSSKVNTFYQYACTSRGEESFATKVPGSGIQQLDEQLELLKLLLLDTTQQPVVIRQGGNGLGSVIAALILAAAAVYAINVWSTTKKDTSPAKSIEQGIERIKDAAGKAIESRN